MTKREAVFSKDMANRKLTVTRSFGAPIGQVWKAWTESELLNQWWAPRPYRMETKSMDFREGGHWLYAMSGPQGDKHWCKESYKGIAPQQFITNDAEFCDEAGKGNRDMPTMHWKKEFTGKGSETTVNVEITYDSTADMETIIKMGFEQGFTMGLNNLEELLSVPA
jgi:uncharacterized protein YndB with AHSA1/START domain